jgi:sugar/nucleoside kinase (ribokinase family)
MGSSGSTLTQTDNGVTIHLDAVPLERLGLQVVNTVGCGDAFIGAFAVAKVNGLDDIEALRQGNAAGSFKATRKETRGGPTRVELSRLIERWRRL